MNIVCRLFRCRDSSTNSNKVKVIQLVHGQNIINFAGDSGMFIINPAEAGNRIDKLKNGNGLIIIQISPDAQETVLMVNSNDIKLQGNISWEMTNTDVLVLYFLSSGKVIEISRTNR